MRCATTSALIPNPVAARNWLAHYTMKATTPTPIHVDGCAIPYLCFRKGSDMKPRSDRIIAEWAADNQRTWVRRRDWHGGYRLAALCVMLLFGGLAALLLLGSSLLATICWIGSAASGVTMLRRSRNRRFFITRIGDFQGRR